MPKTDFTQYDKDPANNTDVDGVDIAEGCAPSGINNAIRSVMSHIAEMNDGTVPLASPDINGGTLDGVTIGGTTAGAGMFTTLQANTSLNVDGTVTADGLTVDSSGTSTISSSDVDALKIERTTAGAVGVRLELENGNDVDWSIFNDGGGNLKLTRSGTTYFQLDADGDLSLYEDTGTTPKFFWDSSAEALGIGTSSPATFAKLHVNDSSNTFAYTKFTNSTTGTTNTDGLTVGISSANALIYNYESGNIQFATAGTERMRIDSSGDLLIGCTTSPSSSVLGAAFIDDGGGSKELRISSPVTSTDNVCLFYNPNGNVGRIQTFGSATNYSTSSDYRLKEDWQPMTGATERVKALNPVNFAWKIDGSRVDGFLAHEAQEIVPEAVTGEKDAMREEEYEVTPAVLDEDGNVVTEAVMGTRQVPDYQGIDQSKLVPLLTAALQEAIAEIETLKTKVAALENA